MSTVLDNLGVPTAEPTVIRWPSAESINSPEPSAANKRPKTPFGCASPALVGVYRVLCALKCALGGEVGIWRRVASRFYRLEVSTSPWLFRRGIPRRARACGALPDPHASRPHAAQPSLRTRQYGGDTRSHGARHSQISADNIRNLRARFQKLHQPQLCPLKRAVATPSSAMATRSRELSNER